MSAIKIQNEPQRRRRSSQRGLLMQPRPDLPVLSDGETQLVVRLRDRTHEANRERQANFNTWVLSKAAAMIKLWLVCVLSTVLAPTPCTSRGRCREPAERRWTVWRRSHLKSRNQEIKSRCFVTLTPTWTHQKVAPHLSTRGWLPFTFQNLKDPYYEIFQWSSLTWFQCFQKVSNFQKTP